MVEIKPFRGWFYDKDMIGEITKVVAPPHDVISAEQHKKLRKKSKYNIVSVLLPADNDYKKAARILRDLISEKILIKDKTSAYYAYEQEFDNRGKKMKRVGIMALVKAGPLGKDVLPHEKTFPEKVKDRKELLCASHAELCPVFGLYKGDDDLRKTIYSGSDAPLIEFIDDDGVKNRIWRVKETGKITRFFEDQKIIIADGHHRYTAASQFAKEGKGDGFTLMYLADVTDPALKILPTHRLVEHQEFDLDRFLKEASEHFHAKKANGINALESMLEDGGKHSFGLHTKKGSYLLKLKDADAASLLIKGGSDDWKKLDVSVLHRLMIDGILGADIASISYSKSHGEVAQLIDGGVYDVAFLLPHSDVGEVVKIAENREVMPHKSTYFYPKPMAGVVIHIVE